MTNTRCSYFHCASYLHNMKHCHSQNSLQKLHNLILSFCLHCIVHFDTLNLFLDSILTFNKKKSFLYGKSHYSIRMFNVVKDIFNFFISYSNIKYFFSIVYLKLILDKSISTLWIETVLINISPKWTSSSLFSTFYLYTDDFATPRRYISPSDIRGPGIIMRLSTW